METSVVINEHGRLALPYASLATIEAHEHLSVMNCHTYLNPALFTWVFLILLLIIVFMFNRHYAQRYVLSL